MPIVAEFFGIVIRMYYQEHGIPHFHAEHNGARATYTLDGAPLAGNIPSRTARRLIAEWALAHRDDLYATWHRLRSGGTVIRIDPLT